MSKPFSLLDLIHYVGQEPIRIQPLAGALTAATRPRKSRTTKVTFVTNEITPNDLLFEGKNRIGLILWIEKSRLPPSELIRPA